VVVSQACRLRRLWPHRLPTAGLPHSPLSVDFFPRLVTSGSRGNIFPSLTVLCYRYDASFTIYMSRRRSIGSALWHCSRALHGVFVFWFLISLSLFFSFLFFHHMRYPTGERARLSMLRRSLQRYIDVAHWTKNKSRINILIIDHRCLSHPKNLIVHVCIHSI
jgi:hypothetical protein